MLVALDARGYSPGAVATAVQLAARRRRGIHVLVPITVPTRRRSTPTLPEQERAAQTIIEQARIQGGRRVTGHYEKVRAGQAGRLIVEEAREMRAHGDRACRCRRAGGGSVFGRTLETVLAERPCRVIIETDAGARQRRAGARAPRRAAICAARDAR